MKPHGESEWNIQQSFFRGAFKRLTSELGQTQTSWAIVYDVCFWMDSVAKLIVDV